MNPYVKALEARMQNGEVSQEIYEGVKELFKEPEEPIETVDSPNLHERISALEAVIVDILLS